jgi:hypothetical protein
MPGWRGGNCLPTEAAEQPGVSTRTVEHLVAASQQSVQPGMARGGGPGRGQARRATYLIMRSAAT